MYAQMLVGMVAYAGQYWLDVRKPREEMAAHLVNLAWNGMSQLDPSGVAAGAGAAAREGRSGGAVRTPCRARLAAAGHHEHPPERKHGAYAGTAHRARSGRFRQERGGRCGGKAAMTGRSPEPRYHSNTGSSPGSVCRYVVSQASTSLAWPS